MLRRLRRMTSLLSREGALHARQGAEFYLTGKLAGQRPGFSFQGGEYPYFLHKYNHAWLGERTVEVPIARAWLRGRPAFSRLLEVGNVMSHYGKPEDNDHDIVDLYERAGGVINKDIADYVPADHSVRYNSILSISTLEHIGEDAPTSKARREHVRKTMANLARLTALNGELLATIPLGTGTPLETEIEKAALGDDSFFTRVAFLRRTDAHNNWEEAAWEDVRHAQYDAPFPAANAIAVCWRETRAQIPGG